MSGAPVEIAPGIWRWTARHPEWHPGEFGAQVASFALTTDHDLLLIDPLVPDDDESAAAELLERLDELARGRVASVLITIGYHVRSGESLANRYGGRIFGPPTSAKRLTDRTLLTELPPAGATAFTIGKPRRSERPIWLPQHRALAFGDAIVTNPGGELRMWAHDPVDDRVRRFYRDRFAPTLAPLLELPAEHVLVTHGRPVVGDGARKLREAIAAEPWYHHG